jgi:hypothetical protein
MPQVGGRSPKGLSPDAPGISLSPVFGPAVMVRADSIPRVGPIRQSSILDYLVAGGLDRDLAAEVTTTYSEADHGMVS